MPDDNIHPTIAKVLDRFNTPVTEKDLRQREGQRLVNVIAGRDDDRTHEYHYLVIERMPIGKGFGPDEREIEQYWEIERLVQNALDFETGDRHGKWLGAFSATYHDGKLVSVQMIDNMRVRLEVAKHNRLTPHKAKNRLVIP